MTEFRIVSLCPSTTLTMFDLGLADCLVGRTIFCNKPADKIGAIAKVGGTKNPKFDKIRSLNPTHILFNMEENDAAHLPQMQSICEVVVTTPVDIESTCDMITLFGDTFLQRKNASGWARRIRVELERIKAKRWKPFRYAYVIWREPIMLAGAGTYITELLALFGGVNVALELSESRYPEATEGQLAQAQVGDVLLSSEPFPFKEKHREEFNNCGENVRLIDGEAASWHGTYTLHGLLYLEEYFSDSE